jgi:SAM-dependent methyltransferase
VPDIETLLDTAATAEYDFRHSANPADPSKHLFDEWVPYYHLKWAIARVLKPRRILEIGVRFGYSAAAFLDACPDAAYLGIDNDSDSFGGHKGAIRWAKCITQERNAQFLIADSQQLEEFPGGPYDLVHIDGQQDGVGSLRDLTKALHKARYILFDGYFWNRTNFLHVSEFLYSNRDIIASYVIIPGYAGELLITPQPATTLPGSVRSSRELRSVYTTAYYLRDCGGWETYKRDQGGSLGDQRLRAIGDLTELAPLGRAIDLGCGRGELSVHLARLGHEVTAVDYSESAIELAQAAAASAERVAPHTIRINFQCADINQIEISGSYDLAVASDLVEHLTPAELDSLYACISSHLDSHGLFIIHTFPNAWYYRYEHARRLREARKLDAYIPLEPRTRYEQLMHVNEQSPRSLRRQLRTHFPYVLVWFATHDFSNPFENLKRRFSKNEMRAAGDLFAIAGHTPILPGILYDGITMPPIATPIELLFELLEIPTRVPEASRFIARVRLINNSQICLKSRLPNPIHLSYHCYSDALQLVTFDGLRTVIPTLKAGFRQEIEMQLSAPSSEGRFLFRLTLVQEEVMWFDVPPQNLFVEKWVEVS